MVPAAWSYRCTAVAVAKTAHAQVEVEQFICAHNYDVVRLYGIVTGTGKPVLVVEDHVDTREMVEMFLQFDGYRVCAAADGREALECVARETPCLILLDVTMPVMDGPTFARLLHESPDPELAATPIVLLTAVPNARAVMREIGAVDLIPKPVSLDRVLGVVTGYCPS